LRLRYNAFMSTAGFLPLILSGAAFVSGVAYIAATYGGPFWLRYTLKPLTTLLILAVAASFAAPISTLYRTLIIVGIAFSLAGDVFLMLPQNTFVFGLVSFLIAHIFYIFAYRSVSGFHLTWWLALPYTIYGFFMLYLLWPHVGDLRIPVIIYAAVLMIMGWQAAEQWWHVRDTSMLLAMIGAILFILSDTTLALTKFRAPVPQRDLIIMSTYYGAQLLIAWSVYRFPK
jgi:uncharacterized membrane protein YhhN